MSTSAACPLCDGWRWRPLAVDGSPVTDWQHRGWLVLVDPELCWQRCTCSPRGNRSRLQEVLAHLLLQRLDEAVDAWEESGAWQRGRIGALATVWRHRDIYCLQRPGAGWLLASPMGVMRDLRRPDLAHHLERAGTPPLPAAD